MCGTSPAAASWRIDPDFDRAEPAGAKLRRYPDCSVGTDELNRTGRARAATVNTVSRGGALSFASISIFGFVFDNDAIGRAGATAVLTRAGGVAAELMLKEANRIELFVGFAIRDNK